MNPKTITDEQITSFFDKMSEQHDQIQKTIAGEPCKGIPTFLFHLMEHSYLERISGMSSYKEVPIDVYRAVQEKVGVSFIDQWIPENPLSMESTGYVGAPQSATTGLEHIIVDGMEIKEPEDVCLHMEKFFFPRWRTAIKTFDIESRVREIGLNEYNTQQQMGDSILKTGYGFIDSR